MISPYAGDSFWGIHSGGWGHGGVTVTDSFVCASICTDWVSLGLWILSVLGALLDILMIALVKGPGVF